MGPDKQNNIKTDLTKLGHDSVDYISSWMVNSVNSSEHSTETLVPEREVLLD